MSTKMRDRHLHVPEDAQLHALLIKKVKDELPVDKKGNRRLIWFKFLIYAGASSLLYTLFYLPMWDWLFIGVYIAFGFAILLLGFNFAHDLSHHALFKKRKLNQAGFIALYTLNGAHAEAWQHRHINAHHFAPNVEGYDSDLKISQLIRVTPGSKLKPWHRFQHLYAPLAYCTYSFYWVFIKDFVILLSPDVHGDDSHKGAKFYASFIGQKLVYVGYLLILPLLFSPHSAAVVLIAFLLMHATQSLFLLFTFFMTHHVENTKYPVANEETGRIQTSWIMNQVVASNDMYPFSKGANFLFGGFNNHVAHHLFPHIHHVNYPKLSRIIYKVLRDNGIEPNQTSYFGGVLAHLRLLKRMSYVSS